MAGPRGQCNTGIISCRHEDNPPGATSIFRQAFHDTIEHSLKTQLGPT